MTSKFTHLHLHTEYSLLDGFCPIDRLIDKVKEEGMDSVAITDHGNLYGAIEFYKKAKSEGIKPIIGCEIYVSERDYRIKDPTNKRYYHLVLLAKNSAGYKNLLKIVSEGYINGFYYKPRVDKEVLRKYSSDLFALSACLNGEINQRILEGDREAAYQAAKEYEEIFGKGNFFLEIQDHGLREDRIVNPVLLEMHRDLGIEMVATNDCHYIEKSDAYIQDVLLCIQTASLLEDEDRMKMPANEFYLKSPEEMDEIFSAYEGAIENTQKIADACNLEIKFHEPHSPYFSKAPEGLSNYEYLEKLVGEGLSKKYSEITDEIRERRDKELNVIRSMGYVDYFLIVRDYVKFAKDHDIAVGPGRGSAAGSIIAYALDITEIDPLKYDLIFERFLNPERVSMPDIDVDFCYENRDRVVSYVNEEYGRDHVSQIVTFGRMQARNAIRDVGRVLDISYNKVDRLAKMIPNTLNMTIDLALTTNEKLKETYEKDPETKRIIDTAKKIEGLPRNTSIHAAGVVMSKEVTTDLVPLARSNDQVVTQYNMTEIEELGLLKMDFLGLRNLTVIQDTVRDVEKNQGIKIDISRVDENDPEVMALFNKGETMGVFQFESAGMRNFLKKLRPTQFEDLIAANSLFRPGPMNEIPRYIHNKNHPEDVTYIDPALEPILSVTYGIIVYQEQVMQIVQRLAGFSLGEADNLRRAMSKKKMAVMEENREIFVNGKVDEEGKVLIPGCVRNGVKAENAEKIYNEMIDFAKYAFNKSHSAAYSLVAVQTAYLKRYYPGEYLSNLISSVMGNSSKVYLYINEAKRMGMEILPPDINESFAKFTSSGKKMRFGLAGIKNVGKNLVDAIIEEREKGVFKNFKDFIGRMEENFPSLLNKKALESFIKAGAFDSFGYKRSSLLAVSDSALEYAHENSKINVQGQINLLDLGGEEEVSDIVLPEVNEFPKKIKLSLEKEVLGFYITDHPLSAYKDKISDLASFTNLQKTELSPEEMDRLDGREVTMVGIISSVSEKMTKKKDLMAFASLEDMDGVIEIIIFPTAYRQYRNLVTSDKAVLVRGKLQSDDSDLKLIANDFYDLDQIDNRKVYLKMEYKRYNNIKGILKEFPGNLPVIIYFSDKKKSVALKKDLWVKPDEGLLQKMENELGKSNVKVK